MPTYTPPTASDGVINIDNTFNAMIKDDVNKRTVNFWIIALAEGGNVFTFPDDTTGYSLIIKCDYTAFTTATINTSHDYTLLQYYRSAGAAVNTP